MCRCIGTLFDCLLLWLRDLLLCSELQSHASNGGGVVYSKAPYPYKTFWKDMLAEPSKELGPGKRHGLLPSPVAVIFGYKPHMGFRDIPYAVIGDSHPVGVLSEVGNHMLRVRPWMLR